MFRLKCCSSKKLVKPILDGECEQNTNLTCGTYHLGTIDMKNPNMTKPFRIENGWGPVDAGWVILCTFIVFTMQPGFALQEAGTSFFLNQLSLWLLENCFY